MALIRPIEEHDWAQVHDLVVEVAAAGETYAMVVPTSVQETREYWAGEHVAVAVDGDTAFALATGARAAVTGIDEVELQTAAADCVSLAVVRAVLAATSVDRTADGGLALPSYRDALVEP